jgi:hypothetical protein
LDGLAAVRDSPQALFIAAIFFVIAFNFLRDMLWPVPGAGGATTWRSDHNDWESSRHSSFHSSSSHSSGGGSSFHGGGASGHW